MTNAETPARQRRPKEDTARQDGGQMSDVKTQAQARGLGAAGRPRRPGRETTRLAKAIYEREIRRQVEDAHHGEIISIDVDSGDWAIGDSVLSAVDRLRAKSPDANDIFSLRIGYGVLRHFGGRPWRRAE